MKTERYLAIAAIATMGLAASSCSDWLDQEPMSNVTTSSYYKTADDFEASANYLYGQLYGFSTTFSGNEMYAVNFDYGTDLSIAQNSTLSGIDGAPNSDVYYTKPYQCLRKCNDLLEQCEAYSGSADISNSWGTAYFFRAWWHFFLLKRYGGIALATEAPSTTSDVVWGPRNSRYEVVALILSDLENAMRLVKATKASTGNNGSLTIEAVCAFKARVCLFEGTWEEYNGRGSEDVTNGDGSSSGAGTAMPSDYPSVNDLLTMARTESAKFVEGGTYANEYSLWMGCEDNAEPYYAKRSYFYLFCLEESDSNPNGLDKTSNNEAIFRKCYDYANNAYGGMNLTHSFPSGFNRKMADMFLCTDGLPIHKSPLFKGYANMEDEFQNRDNRMRCFGMPKESYWRSDEDGARSADYSVVPTIENNPNGYSYANLLTYGAPGYGGRKFVQERYRNTNQESADYLHIRLPEMLLTYAEATIELSGNISDSDLAKTINVIRKRAYIADLTNALVNNNGLDMKEEIRRERAIELFAEGFRLSDLCRWGIADKELARPTCSFYVYENGNPTEYRTGVNPVNGKNVYDPTVWEDRGYVTTEETAQSTYTAGMPTVKPGALITETGNNRIFSRKNYVQAIPLNEIALNDQLKQNPGW